MGPIQTETFKLLGIIKDIEPVELMNGSPPSRTVPTPAVWTHGQNVYFDTGSTNRAGGFARFADPLPVGAQPIFALNVLSPTQAWWIWVDGQNTVPVVYVTDGINHFDISPTLTGGAQGQWSGCVLNGVPVMNNQIDPPIWWDGETGNVMQTLPDWPAVNRCAVIRAYKYHLIALNMTINSVQIPELFHWSSAADPGTIPQEWAPLPENDAGSNTLATGPGGIIDALPLRDDFILYKAHSTFIMSYIGGQFVFSVRKLFNTSGVQAINCVAEMRGQHWVFSDDDMIIHDGNTFQSIADNKVRSFVLNGINPDTQLLAQVVANAPLDEVWFCYPTVDSDHLVLALIYSFIDDEWGLRELPNVAYIAAGIVPESSVDPTWDAATTVWDLDQRIWNQSAYSITNNQLLMFSPLNEKIYNVDRAPDADGEDLEAYVERTDWTIGGETSRWQNKLVQAVTPVVTGTQGDKIYLQVAGTRHPGQSIQWSSKLPITIGEQDQRINVLSHGRYMNMKFSSVGGQPWQIHRVGVEYVTEGRY